MIKTKLFIILFCLLLGGSINPSGSKHFEIPDKDFFKIKGKTITHQFVNTADNLSDNKIIELQSENGLTTWFGRYFYKDICTTGVCRMVRLWIFWDGTGNFLGIQMEKNDPLTKSDHTDFGPEDYVRLDVILADTISILKDLSYEDLTVEEKDDKIDKGLFEVDGYSSATTPLLKEYVVKDAVFTCYTLWHTVYGETKKYIEDLLKERVNSEYITLLLKGNKNQQLFVLTAIRYQDKYFKEFENHTLRLITSENKEVTEMALSLIDAEYLSSPENQKKFIELMDTSRPDIKYSIIYKMQMLDNVSNEAIVQLLDKFLNGKISAGGLNQIYKIIGKQLTYDKTILTNKDINIRLLELSKNADAYTANLTKSFLKNYY